MGGCGHCGGKSKPKAAKIVEPKTTGAWKLTANGKVTYYDTRVGATAENLRRHAGNGVVERNA